MVSVPAVRRGQITGLCVGSLRESEHAALRTRADRLVERDRRSRRSGHAAGCAAAARANTAGANTAGPNTAGPNTAGANTTGPNTTGANTAGPNTAAQPNTARQLTSRLRRHRYLRPLPRRSGKEHRALAPRAGEGCPNARGHARLRELPWSRAGARRRRREGTHQAIQHAQAGRGQRDLPHLPQPRQSRGVGRQHARSAKPLVHDVSQRAQAAVVRAPAGEGDRDAAVRDLSSPAGREDRARGGAHAGSRGQDVVLVVPQPARLDQQRQEPEGREFGQRAVHELSRRDARTDAVRARAGARELHDLPRSARLVERSHAERTHADAVSALSRRDADIPSSVYDNAAITTNKSNRMFGRSCVNCHSNIHGSNHPSGQFFMR